MGVVSIGIGRKRVHLTAFCPDDALGLLACEFVLGRVRELLDQTSEEEMESWLVEQNPDLKSFFDKLREGWQLPKGSPLAIDPKNATAEARIVGYLQRERLQQCRGKEIR